MSNPSISNQNRHLEMSNPPSNQNPNPNQPIDEGIHQHVIFIPEAEYKNRLRSVQESVKKVPTLLKTTAGGSSCSIFRAPETLMKIHPKAFKPLIVSIGPYHHGRKHLQTIQEHKRRFLGAILDRTQTFNVGLDDFFKVIALKENQIRESYSETLKYNRYDLIEMMVLDGCFIMELLCVVGGLVEPDDDEPIFRLQWILYTLMRDLIMLENQIPLFVLEAFFELSFPKLKNSKLKELIFEFFGYTFHGHQVNDSQYRNLDGEHLLALYRSSFIPSAKGEPTGDEDLGTIRPVNRLREAGIEFEINKTAESFLDIKFKPHKGVLEIPGVPMNTFASNLLLNCVAFEQCYSHCSKHFTSYVAFVCGLINTTFDAGYLFDRGIMGSGTDEEVVKYFGELKDDIFYDDKKSYLGKVIQDLNKFYHNIWNVRMAGCIYNYCGSPWIFISAFAAFILLVLTIIQCFFAVYAYVKPPK